MATIALYARQVNQMPELVRGIKSAVNDYKTELLSLQMKAYSIGTRVCDLDDVVASIQSSTKTQEEKVTSFDALEKETEEFIENAVSVDRDVADVINKQRNEFYEQYAYLKPECEKSGWDKFCEGCDKVVDWCNKNLESITAILVAGIIIGGLIAVSLLSFNPLIIMVAIGVGVAASVGGQFISDCIASVIAGEMVFSSWQTYIGGAIGGIVGGLLALFTANPVVVSSISAGVATFFTKNLENFSNDEKNTALEIFGETGVSCMIAGIFAKFLPIRINKITKGKGNFAAVYKARITAVNNGTRKRFSSKIIGKGGLSELVGSLSYTLFDGIGRGLFRRIEKLFSIRELVYG